MKPRKIFFLSVAFAIFAVWLRLGALGQFQDGYRVMRETGVHQFPAEQSRRGALLLYFSVPVAMVSAACVFVSHQRREPAWRWVTMALLGIYLLVSFAPA